MLNQINKPIRVSKIAMLSICLLLAIIIFTKCINETVPTVISNNKGQAFAGSEKCKDCHSDIYKGFASTAHNITSQLPSVNNISGSFDEGENMFTYSYYDRVIMNETDSGFYQVHLHGNNEKQRRRMDMIIGSGVRGQSFAGWQDDKLYQLPVSYFTSANTWVNSPGYNEFIPDFSRVISTRCLECHVSFLKDTASVDYVSKPIRTQIIYGVQCERCHGPAAEHVTYQQAHPGEKKAMYMPSLQKLNRKASIDLCTYCHGGMRQGNRPAFGYEIGDTIENHHLNKVDTANFDVHGNLYDMLSISECFKNTATLKCNSCHNPHLNQRQDVQTFSSHCMTCHTKSTNNFCTLNKVPDELLKTNCIDCHMPVKKSSMLTVDTEAGMGTTKPAMLRSHYISIYPNETAAFLKAHGW